MRANQFATTSPERHQPTGKPAIRIHLGDQHPLAVGREIGEVRHAGFALRHVDVTLFRATLSGGYHHKVPAAANLAEHDVMRVNPRESGGVGE